MKNVSFILWKKLNGLFGQPNRMEWGGREYKADYTNISTPDKQEEF